MSRVDDLRRAGDLTMRDLKRLGGVTVGPGFGERLQQALDAADENGGAPISADLAMAVVETANEAFVGMSAEGAITAWNSAAESTFGWSAEEAIGRMVADTVVPQEHREAHRRGLERFLRTGDGPVLGKRLELSALHKDGHEFPVEMTISSVRGDDGWSFHAFMHDISDRKRQDAERQRNARYRELQLAVSRVLAESATADDAIPGVVAALGKGMGWEVGGYWKAEPGSSALRCEVFWRWDGSDFGDFESATRALELQPGEGLPGRVHASREPAWIEDVSADPDFPRADPAAAAGLRGAVAVPLMRETRVVGVLEFFSSKLRPPDEGLSETLAVISGQVGQFIARKEAEAEAEKLKDEFFALVSHELRTPLTSVIGYTDMLEKTEADLSERGHEMIEVIRRNAKREMRLVGDLLLLVRIKAGRFDLQPGSVELEKVVKGSAEAVAPAAEEAQVNLSVEIEQVPSFHADSDRIGQAIDNLLTNAIKFTPPGGSVKLRLCRRGGEAVIQVADSGVGIPPEDQARLFDRLYRASSATENHVPGTGLGLTIVKAIVEAHGGSVSVASTPSEGSTFTISLPVHAEEPAGDAEAQSEAAA